jgi:CHAT domain-containing protein
MQVGAKPAVEKVAHSRRVIFTRRRVVISLSALVLLIIAGIAILWWWQSYTAQAMRLLVRKFSDQRTVEGRLAGGFKGGRFVPPTADDTLLQATEIIDASHLLDKAIAANEAGARLAYARLLLLTSEKAPATLKAFQQVVETQPASAAAINDLGVCLLAHDQLEEALTKFEEALKQQPEMPEALFNRALCYQQLQLRDAASTDFARLLEIERDRSWRDEIRRRHQDVSTAISPPKEVAEEFDRAFAAQDFEAAGRVADDNLGAALRYAYDDCSREYLKATALDEAKTSERELSKIRLIGERMAAVSGDKSYLALAAYLQGLSRQDAANQLTLIGEYLEIEKLPSIKIAMGRQSDLQKLSLRFKESGNQLFEFFSTYQTGYLDSCSNLFSHSMAKMREALKIAESRKWPYQSAVVLAQMGNICTRIGQDSLALAYCGQAIPEDKGLPYIESKALQYMANAYWHMGNSSKGLLYLRQSSNILLTKLPLFNDLANNALLAADFYRSINNHNLALLYARQALGYAEAGKFQSCIAQTASFIAVELAELNQVADSESKIQQAFATLEKLTEDQRRYSKMLVLLRAGGLASRQGKFEQAEQHFAQAQTIAEMSEEKELPLIKILKARAASYARAGQPKRASADLNHAIALIEAYRNNISERSNRSDFFDASQDVFDQMIQLQARAFGQMDKAFNISEQARARTLLDDITATASNAAAIQASQIATTPAPFSIPALTLNKIRTALPDDLTLISYSVTSGGTLIFVVRRDDFIAVTSEVSTEDLDRLVQDYVAGLKEQAPVEKLAEQSRRLYQLLIAPVEAKLGTTNRLCIAPDKALHRLPFDALLDAAGNYLIQSHVLTSVPSASTLVYCLKQAQRKNAVVDENLLAIGNPLFSRDHFPDLLFLPDAEHEVYESALSYSHPAILTGPKATKAQTLAELMNCDVAHFSTHCLVKEKTPWLAALVLAQASENPDDELLRLNEFNKIGLLRARLVILSACQSGLGQYYRGEGIVSLVRPFLARSVPSVVASLWPVDSQATATLMIDFHRARKQNGRLAADALRTAQTQMIQSASFNHPYYWAPFVVVGSNN